MKLLILGGTRFLGRHITETALSAGHEVTLFNRGQTNPDLFPEVETLTGDRDGGLDALKGRTWDAAIDPSGYVPRLVGDSVRLLADAVEHYTFISSISVYSDVSTLNLDESGPLLTLEDESTEDVYGGPSNYGGLKVLCERVAEAAMPGRVLHVRSGLIVGPHDPTNRFTYWAVRAAEGGDMLAPVGPDFPVQYIDARDQAAWILRMAAARKGGIYNVTGPDNPATLGELITTAAEVAGVGVNPVWADEGFLTEQEVAPWMGLPFWVPQEMLGMLQVNVDKALADGLTFRPLADTVRATLDWYATEPADKEWPAGISREKEQSVLAVWRQRTP